MVGNGGIGELKRPHFRWSISENVEITRSSSEGRNSKPSIKIFNEWKDVVLRSLDNYSNRE